MSIAVSSDSFEIGNQESVLLSVLEHGTHLALWRCHRPAGLNFLDNLKWEEIRDISLTFSIREMGGTLQHRLEEAGYPVALPAKALADTISVVVSKFADIMRTKFVSIRLEVVEADACSNFHHDHVPARLIMPLSGPGTQWIEAERPTVIHHMKPGEVAIFKGGIWAERPRILHRSPPVSPTGEPSLRLVADPSFERGLPGCDEHARFRTAGLLGATLD